MRTTKPISTISFNTPAFLLTKLRELTKAGVLSFWAAIVHQPEDDEGGKKQHIHVYAEPARMLQTDDLKEQLRELDLKNPEKPLGCISWHTSKFGDWYLYSLHDRAYLASKGQSRRFHYSAESMYSSDSDDLTYKARSIDMLGISPYAAMLDAQKAGMEWDDFFRRGCVPIQQIKQWREAWYTLCRGYTDRAGREGHPNEPETAADHECSESKPETAADHECSKSGAVLVSSDTGEFIGTEDEFFSFE